MKKLILLLVGVILLAVTGRAIWAYIQTKNVQKGVVNEVTQVDTVKNENVQQGIAPTNEAGGASKEEILVKNSIESYKKAIAQNPSVADNYIALAAIFNPYGFNSEPAKKVQAIDPETYKDLPRIISEGALKTASDPGVVAVLSATFVEYYGRSGSRQEYEKAILAAEGFGNKELISFAQKYITDRFKAVSASVDVAVKGSLASSASFADEYFSSTKSFKGICTTPGYKFSANRDGINKFTASECNDTLSDWAISARISTGYWCVDNVTSRSKKSTGILVQNQLGSAIKCQ